MRDLRFQHPPQADRGRLVVRAQNADGVDHTLTLVRLPDDVPGTTQEIILAEHVVPTVVIVSLKPGESSVFAVDLAPGRYGFVCFNRDPDGVQHVTRGMASELTVA